MNTHINLDKIKGTPIFKALSRLSVLLILFIILAFTTHNFIKASNLSTILLQVAVYAVIAYGVDRKSTRLNSSHDRQSRMPSSA